MYPANRASIKNLLEKKVMPSSNWKIHYIERIIKKNCKTLAEAHKLSKEHVSEMEALDDDSFLGLALPESSAAVLALAEQTRQLPPKRASAARGGVGTLHDQSYQSTSGPSTSTGGGALRSLPVISPDVAPEPSSKRPKKVCTNFIIYV